jgi:hypothetical protein
LFRTIDPNVYANPINAHSSLEGGDGIQVAVALLLLLQQPVETDRIQPPMGFAECDTCLFMGVYYLV